MSTFAASPKIERPAYSDEIPAMTINIWRPHRLGAPDRSPGDAHFVDWLVHEGVTGRRIYHFGTGPHHFVGLECARPHLNNTVLGITSSPREYELYIDLVGCYPEVTQYYVAYFGDIYMSRSALLPRFDVVTLFHLCKFRAEASRRYGAKTDGEVLRLFARHVEPDGYLVFCTDSPAYPQAQAVISSWAGHDDFAEVDEFKSLRIFRRAM